MDKLQIEEDDLLSYLARQYTDVLQPSGHLGHLTSTVDFSQLIDQINSFYADQQSTMNRMASCTIDRLNHDFFKTT